MPEALAGEEEEGGGERGGGRSGGRRKGCLNRVLQGPERTAVRAFLSPQKQSVAPACTPSKGLAAAGKVIVKATDPRAASSACCRTCDASRSVRPGAETRGQQAEHHRYQQVDAE